MTEMLASPLRFLSYLGLHARFGDQFMFSHELTLLSYHLRGASKNDSLAGITGVSDSAAP